jgi:uncharacterized protein YggT (Ycf19 family)
LRGKPRERESIFTFHFFLSLLVTLFVVFLLFLLWWGGPYYSTPFTERVFHPLHSALKPSGSVGINLGILGLSMMVAIFAYSLRKRSKTLQKIGTQAHWLQSHIFLGIAGPTLITFHTSGKFGGLVAIAFWSMWAIVASGFIGRYLYAKIPRTLKGNQMTLKEIEEQLAQLVEALRASERRAEVLQGIEQFLAHSRQQKGGLLQALGRLFIDDVQLPLNVIRIWIIVGTDPALSLRQRLSASRLVLKQRRILDKLAVLDASRQLFSYWHIFHKPFTIMTFSIAFLHVSLALYLGFGPKW